MKNKSNSIFLTLLIFTLSSLEASFLSNPIIQIPKGTIFTLEHELEIPANRNFIILGENTLDKSFNEINQHFNQQNNNYYAPSYNGSYYTYNSYLTQWRESTNRAYQDCLNRHRVHYSYDNTVPTYSNNNIIVNNAYGNTNVIINNKQIATASTYGSYQGNNTCIQPKQTISALLINKKNATSGGIFRKGYTFKVRKVSYKKRGNFYWIDISFNHKVLKGIRIITTLKPSSIKIYQLQKSQDSDDGFWSAVGSALASSVNIGGNYFRIDVPEKRYFD